MIWETSSVYSNLLSTPSDREEGRCLVNTAIPNNHKKDCVGSYSYTGHVPSGTDHYWVKGSNPGHHHEICTETRRCHTSMLADQCCGEI